MVHAGLSGLYIAGFNISTRQGPPHRKKTKPQLIGCECGRSVRKKETMAPMFPAPVVQALLAHASPRAWARSSPAVFGKGTH